MQLLSSNVQKKEFFKDIIQIKVDHPPSYPIFDKLFFDNFLTVYLIFDKNIVKKTAFYHFLMHEISHFMKNEHKISENICKKAFIALKFIKNK